MRLNTALRVKRICRHFVRVVIPECRGCYASKRSPNKNAIVMQARSSDQNTLRAIAVQKAAV
jgi:hypothetical protein